MIQIQGKIPRKIHVACSGGVDSLAIAHFLSRSHSVTLVCVDHLTAASAAGIEASRQLDLPMIVKTIGGAKGGRMSQEEYWRNERYKIFHAIDAPVITGHHLDDCVETWIWSSMHGEGKVIPFANKNVIRPFRLNRKDEFIKYATQNQLTWAEDSSNADTKYMRNFIRHDMMECVLRVNPGIHKVIRKKLINEFV
jgi:tRNA(Ile)-lysidine synthase